VSANFAPSYKQYFAGNIIEVTSILKKTLGNYYNRAVVTQHIKTVALLQLITFGYMFRPLPGHHQANKE